VWRAYRYIFYRLYEWGLKRYGATDAPEWNAIFGMSFLVFFDMIGICAVISAVFGISIIEHFPRSFAGMVSPAVGVFGLHYFFLVKGGRLKRIVSEFESESAATRSRGTRLVIFFIVLSLVLPFLAIYIF
jgi:hypothetical protein